MTRQKATGEMVQVRHNETASRYEMEVGGHTAIAEYRRAGRVVPFTHTEVPRELESQGVGSNLIAGALADVRGQDLRIVPECPFVARYVERHPGLQDFVV